MDAFLVAAGFSATIQESRESFTLHARRWLAALYFSVRLSHGDHAADAAAECWLRYFEDRVEEECGLPGLEKATKAAIIVFARNFHTQMGRKLCQ
jgi:hypothetical protein